MANNKVIYNGSTLIDLTGDTVQASYVLSGYTFHLKSGASSIGTCTYNADTSNATADSSDILSGETAYVAGQKVTGDMTNNGSYNITIDDKTDNITIPTGFHDGGGKCKLDSTEAAKIIAGNIKAGVSILGVTGNYSGSAASVQSNKNVTPTASSQTVLPDEGYDYLAQVTVASIPYDATLNASGGYTITIG